ncbi:MAG: cob(I)yrinic acid a,c-diamide adenosyltransferase [Planctomycetaceae bacterium]|jgi:cob(I)alamin adenosyltransferase|nr:cob(I)yrinic acid a,c-diamide adenosyltransferase [Planctomycetaceae bacterium]
MSSSKKTTAEINEAHRKKMIRQDEVFEKKMAETTEEKGLIIVHTGDGKGKSTAAFGMALRALGHDMKVGIVQFIKGAISTGEATIIPKLNLPIEIHSMGEGFTWKTQDRERDIATAGKGWEKAVDLMRDPSFDMVILDELNIALKYKYIDVEKVLEELQNKRHELHVVITGRSAPQELLDFADLASEMTLIKHPFKQGIKPQPGVEF